MWFSHQKKWKLKIKSYLKIKKETCLNYTGNVAGPLNIHLKRPEILFSNSLIQRSPNIFRGHRMECSFTSYWLLPLFDLFFLSKWLYNNKILNHSISVKVTSSLLPSLHFLKLITIPLWNIYRGVSYWFNTLTFSIWNLFFHEEGLQE